MVKNLNLALADMARSTSVRSEGSGGKVSSGSDPARSEEDDKLLRNIFELQKQLIERDTTIHELHNRATISQQDEIRKVELKRGFSVIEKRHVNTSCVTKVLEDAMHHIGYTVKEAFGGEAGVLLLDVPYNSNIGATNVEVREHVLLQSYWPDRPLFPMSFLRELEKLGPYSNVITQKRGKVLSEWEIEGVKEQSSRILDGLDSIMAVPLVVDSGSIGLVIIVNGEYTVRDPPLVKEVLSELWTSNVQPLISISMDNVRKKETEDKLVKESQLRDEIILSLDLMLEETVKLAAVAERDGTIAGGLSMSEYLWTVILEKVADFFESYFSADVLVAVTNAEGNLRMQKLNDRLSSGGSSKKQSSYSVEGLEFMHYIFSDSLKHVRNTKMRHLTHPTLRKSAYMRTVMEKGDPHFCKDCKHITFPCGHMKMNNMLLVPILFCEQPVGMIGLSNGEFSASSGRILQSVFTTFWSMIVKATIMSESQKVLNAALPVEVSERVKKGEKVADSYTTATVLFAEVVGFQEFVKGLEPIEVVEFSNMIYTRLDQLVGGYKLEKIKVIGSCYMVAGGLQDKSGKRRKAKKAADKVRHSQMMEIVDFGLRILEEAQLINTGTGCSNLKLREKLKQSPVQFRIGISEGPLTAGVFCTHKVKYDVLGATVNLASRLQSSGRPGMVQVNSSIYEETKNKGYEFEKRKPICLKGLGLQQTYFISKPREIDGLTLPVSTRNIRLQEMLGGNDTRDKKSISALWYHAPPGFPASPTTPTQHQLKAFPTPLERSPVQALNITTPSPQQDVTVLPDMQSPAVP